MKRTSPADEASYKVYAIGGDATWATGRKRRLGFGFDIFYDESNKVIHNRDTTNQFSDNDVEFVRPGIHISHDLVIDRLSVVTQMGVYLYSKYKGDGMIYHRVAMRYLLYRGLFFNFSIKSHWANADNIEWGFGYKF